MTDINVTNTAGGTTVYNSGPVSGQISLFNNFGAQQVFNSANVFLVAQTADGPVSLSNSGRVTAAVLYSGVGGVNLVNSGRIDFADVLLSSAPAIITNAGFIGSLSTLAIGGITINNLPGSRISGGIDIFSSPSIALNFLGGSYVYTFHATGLATSTNGVNGFTVGTNGAPFVGTGTYPNFTFAVLDPSRFGAEDRSLVNFTSGVSSMLQDRFAAMGMPGGGSGTLGFAADDKGAAYDARSAFAGVSSLAMAYRSEGEATVPGVFGSKPSPRDIVVWASGFGGERYQDQNGVTQRVRDLAAGGAMGFDKQFNGDWRLGLFAGAGNSSRSIPFGIDDTSTDYGFGGVYGRYDRRNYYVDATLYAGGMSNISSRQVANNTVAGGTEIASARYGGWFVSPDVTFGYRLFGSGGEVVTPKLRLRYVGGAVDGYSETGSVQALSVGQRTIGDLEERLGFEVSSVRPVPFGGDLKMAVDLSGVGLHRLGDQTINASLLSQNIAFTTPGRRDTFGGAINTMFDWRPTPRLSVFVAGEGMAMNDRSASATGKGGVRMSF